MHKKNYNCQQITEQYADLTIAEYLKNILKYSARQRQKLTRIKGAILLNGRATFLDRQLKAADILKVIVLADKSYGVTPEAGTLNILYEDDTMLIVNKPPFQLVHPTGNTNSHTLANFLAHNLQQRQILCAIRPIHRLDRDTSGCVVFAKTAAAQTKLTAQLQSGELKRTYLAIISGQIEPANGTITAPIGSAATANKRAVTELGQPAITHYQTLQTKQIASLIKIWLDTGRTHQIRVHFAANNHPLLGDKMYGKRSELINRQALHAAAVSFINLTTNKRETITAPLPNDMQKLLEKIKK